MLPGPVVQLGMQQWSDRFTQTWVLTGTTWFWTIPFPVFDLRPGATPATAMPNAAVGINHEAAIGLSHYLSIVIGSVAGAHPPAIEPGIRAHYFERGNPVAATPMYRLTRTIDISTTLYEGGATVGDESASGISLTPVFPHFRFWQPTVRISIADGGGLTAPVTDFFAIAAIH